MPSMQAAAALIAPVWMCIASDAVVGRRGIVPWGWPGLRTRVRAKCGAGELAVPPVGNSIVRASGVVGFNPEVVSTPDIRYTVDPVRVLAPWSHTLHDPRHLCSYQTERTAVRQMSNWTVTDRLESPRLAKPAGRSAFAALEPRRASDASSTGALPPVQSVSRRDPDASRPR